MKVIAKHISNQLLGNEKYMQVLKVSEIFSKCPGSRYIVEGENSGELFRRDHLEPAIRTAIRSCVELVVDLDGTAGYSTGFVEEAFGGLVRECHLFTQDILKVLKIKSDEEEYLKEDIIAYIHGVRHII